MPRRPSPRELPSVGKRLKYGESTLPFANFHDEPDSLRCIEHHGDWADRNTLNIDSFQDGALFVVNIDARLGVVGVATVGTPLRNQEKAVDGIEGDTEAGIGSDAVEVGNDNFKARLVREIVEFDATIGRCCRNGGPSCRIYGKAIHNAEAEILGELTYFAAEKVHEREAGDAAGLGAARRVSQNRLIGCGVEGDLRLEEFVDILNRRQRDLLVQTYCWPRWS